MKERIDIICFSTTDWDEIWGSRQQIMSRLGVLGHRVFFIERPSGLEHLFRYPSIRKNKIQRWKQGTVNISENVWIMSLPPLLPGRYYSTGINSINQWITTKYTQQQFSDFRIESPVLWIYNPEQFELIGKFDECLSIYHCIDEFTAGTSGLKKQIIKQLENLLVARADIVLANSLPTYQNKLAINRNTYRLSSGVDFDIFDSPQISNDVLSIFSNIPHPRIGFVGNLNERIDFHLIQVLVTQRPTWSFVFVGDTYPLSPDHPSIKHLNSMTNCYLLGKKNYSQIPAFIQQFDVCVMPFVRDERAYYRSPLKLYEYFASGKPVVSTPMPEAEEFSKFIYLAESPERFLAELDKAILEKDDSLVQQRKQVARQNSWDTKVDLILKIIQDHLK
jgi:glycosyltransferase involved in cell wall biosynthesis